MARTLNQDYWEQIIADQTNSGLTQTKWCDQNDINLHNFRYWKNRLRRNAHSDDTPLNPTWMLVTKDAATTTVKPFDPETGQIHLQVGKVTMTLRNSVDSKLLSDVLGVLMHYV